MKSTTSYYQEVITYILENRNKTFGATEMKTAIYKPSKFIKLRKAMDKMANDESYIRHETNAIVLKWDSRRVKGVVKEDNPELLDDCRFLMVHQLKITAIKTYRCGTGLGLKESKEAVERL